MKYIIIILLSIVIGFLLGRNFCPKEDKSEEVAYIMQQSIKNVSKLKVTEAKYTQMFSQKSADKYFFDLISFDKKAVVVATAVVDVEYDLRKLKYNIIPEEKKIQITYIPEPDLNYHYDMKWFDIEQSRLNQFTQAELNRMQEKIKSKFRQEIDRESLKNNGHKRLIIELQRLWMGLEHYGWTIEDMTVKHLSSKKSAA